MSSVAIKELASILRLSVVESKVTRIRHDAAEIESVVEVLAELHKLNPVNTPCADLRIAARALRLTAAKLDAMAGAV